MSDLWSRCIQSLQGWEDLVLHDLVFAYRKAKVDCFFERAIATAQQFAAYEEDLVANLRRLLGRLQSSAERAALVADATLLGEHLLIPKKLVMKEHASGSDGAFFSDKGRAFQHLSSGKQLIAEFRVAGAVHVDLHVLSALWVNRIGHRLDATLGSHAYGSRVRRFGDDGRPSARRYHLRAIGTMPPYFGAYRKWRDDGMAAVQRELSAGQRVICLTLDLRNYFHRIDPAFAAEPAFLKTLGFGTDHPELSPTDRELHTMLCQLLSAWSARGRDYIQHHVADPTSVTGGGIPIGLTAARVLANVLLQPWDRRLVDSLAPIYYGRYVDDMFLVLRDPGSLRNGRAVMDHIASHLPQGTLDAHSGSRHIQLGAWQGTTDLVLQDDKHRVFFLEGQAGTDLMKVIGDEIRDLASERRLMPEMGARSRMASAHVLAASNDVRERADTLRRADGLSIRRMGWAIQLRWAETLTLDVPPKNWQGERKEFFEFAGNHVLRPDRLLDHLDYLPRLLGVALACEDWRGASILIEQATDALAQLKQACLERGGTRLNGYDVAMNADDLWQAAKTGLGRLVWEAVLKSWPCTSAPEGPSPVEDTDERRGLVSLLLREFVDAIVLDPALEAWIQVGQRVRLLAARDLGRTPYKELWRSDVQPREEDAPFGPELEECFGGAAGDPGSIRSLLAAARALSSRERTTTFSDLRPFLLPTRPLSLREIAEWDPSCVHAIGPEGTERPLRRWSRMAQTFRGVRTREGQPPRNDPAPVSTIPQQCGVHVVTVGQDRVQPSVLLCIPNFKTSKVAWNCAAGGAPDLSLARYDQFARFVNGVLSSQSVPDYVFLPELCVPRRWVASIVNRLLEKRINFIGGVEYERSVDGKQVANEAVLSLIDDRLGFLSSVLIWQPKSAAAPGEEEELLRLHDVVLPQNDGLPRVYRHRGLSIGVLLCSELQDIRLRKAFRGQVDCLAVLSWNKDLETFASLVESAALDVHAYVAQVNNREFGDSRVRVPGKQPHQRDLCRVRGGTEDYAVLVDIQIDTLRRFQSRAKAWPKDSDPFKPVPQGFEIADTRKRLPWP